MSEINVNYTIPSELLSGKKVQRSDHGPFYLFSPALPIHRIDYRDSVPTIHPCEVQSCTDWVEKLPEEQCPPGGAVETTIEKDQVGNQIRISTVVKPADAIRNLILDMHAGWGVQEIQSFQHKSKEETNLALFNSLIYPVRIEPHLPLGDFKSKVEKEGGLKVREFLIEAGLEEIKSIKFANQYGVDLQKLFKDGAEECFLSFNKARSYATKELNEADAEIRLRLANAGGKPTYDPRDAYLQWLLARSPIMESSSRDQAPIVVQLPEGFAPQGISSEALAEIISRVTENAVAQALAQNAGGTKSPAKKPNPNLEAN